ncbi:twin-arginine translocation pathway signal [Shimia sp. R9_1]|uniref:lipid-binding SYLF domain-containing protein n=1 Tax=unclassified Shimia TaxID=2630038 RepID=UPI001AD98A08|nr:YSC84-related protein [Shimia sp. R9_1]MBO9408160.1 twin-arginine translocation pathway signal [Shimia sp. R9_1]
MTNLTRRGFALTGLAAAGVTAACGNGVGSNGASEIDARADATLSYLYSEYPNTTDLRDKAAGILVMPLVTEAGFGFGGGYGRGALRVNDVTVDYYSATKGSVGLQIGAQQHAHVLFFMTEGALADFRSSNGWAAGAGAQYVVANEAGNLSAETTNLLAPVIAVIFGQAGLKIGATLEGIKYNRIIP